MPAKAGIQPAYVSLTALGLGPSLRWGDGFWLLQFAIIWQAGDVHKMRSVLGIGRWPSQMLLNTPSCQRRLASNPPM